MEKGAKTLTVSLSLDRERVESPDMPFYMHGFAQRKLNINTRYNTPNPVRNYLPQLRNGISSDFPSPIKNEGVSPNTITRSIHKHSEEHPYKRFKVIYNRNKIAKEREQKNISPAGDRDYIPGPFFKKHQRMEEEYINAPNSMFKLLRNVDSKVYQEYIHPHRKLESKCQESGDFRAFQSYNFEDGSRYNPYNRENPNKGLDLWGVNKSEVNLTVSPPNVLSVPQNSYSRYNWITHKTDQFQPPNFNCQPQSSYLTNYHNMKDEKPNVFKKKHGMFTLYSDKVVCLDNKLKKSQEEYENRSEREQKEKKKRISQIQLKLKELRSKSTMKQHGVKGSKMSTLQGSSIHGKSVSSLLENTREPPQNISKHISQMSRHNRIIRSRVTGETPAPLLLSPPPQKHKKRSALTNNRKSAIPQSLQSIQSMQEIGGSQDLLGGEGGKWIRPGPIAIPLNAIPYYSPLGFHPPIGHRSMSVQGGHAKNRINGLRTKMDNQNLFMLLNMYSPTPNRVNPLNRLRNSMHEQNDQGVIMRENRKQIPINPLLRIGDTVTQDNNLNLKLNMNNNHFPVPSPIDL